MLRLHSCSACPEARHPPHHPSGGSVHTPACACCFTDVVALAVHAQGSATHPTTPSGAAQSALRTCSASWPALHTTPRMELRMHMGSELDEEGLPHAAPGSRQAAGTCRPRAAWAHIPHHQVTSNVSYAHTNCLHLPWQAPIAAAGTLGIQIGACGCAGCNQAKGYGRRPGTSDKRHLMHGE